MNLFAELKRRNVIRVAILYVVTTWLLLQIVDVTAPMLGLPESVGKLVLFLLALGFIPALVVAWVYELTPEGIKRETDVDRSRSITHQTARKLDIAVLVMLGLVVALFAAGRFYSDSAPEPGADARDLVTDVTDIDSIAVLPFEDFSAAGDQEHLAVGLAEAILHMLAQIPDLRVAARTSSFSYRGKGEDVRTIGRELGVGAVLEGSVQRSGETLRIIAQLVRVSDQTHLWSETFDRPTGDIFAIQDEISRAVAQVLRPSGDASSELSSQRTSITAYEHFLRGNDLWQLRTKDAVEAAIGEFKQAIAADPGFAPAHAGLAMAYMFSTYYGERSLEEVRLLVQQSVDQALALDPETAMAYAVRGQLQDDLELRERDYRRAIELNPSDATVYAWLARTVWLDVKRQREANEILEKAYELDPRNPYVLNVYGNRLVNFGRHDEALTLLRKSIALNPELPSAYGGISVVHQASGRIDDAIRARLAEIERAPDSPLSMLRLADLYLLLDDQSKAERWFERAHELNPNLELWPYWFMREATFDQLVGEMRGTSSGDPTTGEHPLCYAYSVTGSYAEAFETCSAAEPELATQPQPAIDLTNGWNATLLYWSARQTERSELANRLLAAMSGAVAVLGFTGLESHVFDHYKARIAAFAGDKDRVIEELNRAVESGFLKSRCLAFEPWWDPYRNDPEFRAVLDDIHARQRRMRNALKEDAL